MEREEESYEDFSYQETTRAEKIFRYLEERALNFKGGWEFRMSVMGNRPPETEEDLSRPFYRAIMDQYKEDIILLEMLKISDFLKEIYKLPKVEGEEVSRQEFKKKLISQTQKLEEIIIDSMLPEGSKK